METIDFVRCIGILIVQNFQKHLLSIILLDFQTPPQLSPINMDFISSIKVSIQNISVVETFSLEIPSILFLASEYRPTDFPNKATISVSTRY